jgi:hypothetical protein
VTALATPARTFALVVGIAEYDAGAGWQLYAPVADAARTVVWLLRRGVPPEQILLFLSPVPPSVVELLASVAEGPLPDGADRVKASLADHSGVDGAIRRTLKSARGDLLVVFWGGHGAVDQERLQRLFLADATEDDRKNVVLDRLLVFLRSSYFAGFPEQIVCVDACASRFDDRASETRLPTDGYPDGKDVPGRNQVVLRAATRGQSALESKRQKKGLFTRELLADLAADADGPWPPDLRSVAARLTERFAELKGELPSEQLPSLWTFNDDDGSLTWRADPRAGRPGRDAARLVDRVVQTRAFQKFFRDGISTPERRPHAVILFGDVGEAHHSLVERVVTGCVQKIAEQSLGERALPPLQQLPWPASGTDLEDRKEQLHELLLRVGSATPETSEPTSAALLRDPSLEGHRLVVYHHVWTLDGWTDDDERLLEWYLGSYWSDLPADDATPRPLIFMKIVCGDELSRVGLGSLLRMTLTPKHRLRSSLERLGAGAGCRRIVLDELEPVPFAALQSWFNDMTATKWLSEAEANKAARRIFAGPDGQLRKFLPMSIIEDALGDLIEPRTEQKAS